MAVPVHPMKKEWVKICNNIKPHYYGNIPEILEQSFPNEDPTVLDYRKKVYEPVSQSIILQAMDDIYRLLSGSKYSIDYESENMRNYANEFKNNGVNFADFIFRVAYSRRVIDPNAVLVWSVTGEGVKDDRKRVDIVGKIIPSSRIHNKIDGEVVVYENDDKKSNTIYYVVTDIFYGRIEKPDSNKQETQYKLRVDYVHNIGRMPAISLGGRPIVQHCKEDGREYVIYRSDFMAAMPHLNRYVIEDNKDVSISLSSGFPFKFLKGITCKTCRGKGKVLPEKPDPENPDKLKKCGTCKGHGKTFPSSPLHGYYFEEIEGATKEDREASLRTKPIDFVSPDVSILEHILKRKNEARQRAEEVLNVRRQSKVSESGKAKEIDRESLYTQLQRISEYVYSVLIEESAYIIQGLRFQDYQSRINVNMPTSFDIKDEQTLMIEFTESLKGTPMNVRYKTYLDWIKRRFHGDKLSHRISELCVRYSPLFLYTIEERESLVAGSGINRNESIKAAMVFNWLLDVSSEINIFETEEKNIFEKLDKIAEPFFQTALEKEINEDEFND